MNIIRVVIQFILSLFKLKSNKPKNELKPKSTTVVNKPTPKPAAKKVTPKPEPKPVVEPPKEEPKPNKALTIKKVKEGNKTFAEVSDGIIEGKFPYFKSKSNSWKGWYTKGNKSISAFVKDHQNILADLDVADSAMNVMRAVSENEGKLEAINAYDGAFLSFGIFQWTLGVRDNAGELPALLKKLKAHYPGAFTEYFGQHGIEVTNDTNTTYGFISLNGEKIQNRTVKETFRSSEWVYRFWRAGLDQKVQATEISHGLSRLKNFYWKWKIHGFALSEIITSEYGVGLILDNHVNLPLLVKLAVRDAMTETGLMNPTNWTTVEEERLIEAYLKKRAQTLYRTEEDRAAKKRGVGPMFNPNGRAKVTLKYVEKGLISKERGSFRYSATGTRSLDGPLVPPPEDYREEDHPEHHMDMEDRHMEFMGNDEQ